MKRTIYGLIISLVCLPVLAQDSDEKTERWYEVEIILFEQLNPVSTGSELWPLDIQHPDLNNAIELLRNPTDIHIAEQANEEELPIEAVDIIEPATLVKIDLLQTGIDIVEDPYLDTPYLILPQEQHQLNDAYQKLISSEDYLPLVHVAWRQIIPPRKQPDRIFVHDKLNIPVEEELLGQPQAMQSELTSLPPSIDFIDQAILEDNIIVSDKPEYNLSGIISLGLGRYIHVGADLLLYKPQLENSLEEDDFSPPLFSAPESMQFVFDSFEIESLAEIETKQAPELFRIQGNLRMPSKEVHFLDHPLVGMLILFTPYEIPAAEETELTKEINSDQTMPIENIKEGSPIQSGRVVEDRSF